jgi:predicted RNA-binding protein with PUA-like domain
VSTSVLVLYGHDGHFDANPLWACVKVDDCYDLSSTSTLTHVKSLEHVCEYVSATDCV